MNEVIRGENDLELEGSVATNTRVGWVLSGPVQIESEETLSSVNFVATTHVLKVRNNIPLKTCPTVEKFSLEETVQRLWDIESLGIRDDTDSVHDSFVKNIFYRQLKFWCEYSTG